MVDKLDSEHAISGAGAAPAVSSWVFAGRIVKVVDGDTYDVLCDLGFSIYHRIRIRLRGVDTPEVWGKNRTHEGVLISEMVRDTLLDKEVMIRTYKNAPSTYNRWEADVFFKDMYGTWISMADFLLANKYAVEWIKK